MLDELPTHIFNNLLNHLNYKDIQTLNKVRNFSLASLANTKCFGQLCVNFPTKQRIDIAMEYEVWGAKVLRGILYGMKQFRSDESRSLIGYILDNYLEEIVKTTKSPEFLKSANSVDSNIDFNGLNSGDRDQTYAFTQMREVFKFMCMEDMSEHVSKILKFYPVENYRYTFRVHGLYWASYYNQIKTILLFEDSEVDNEDMIVAVQNGHLKACKILSEKVERAQYERDDLETNWSENGVGYHHRESNDVDFDLMLEYAVKFDQSEVAEWLIDVKHAKVSRKVLMYAEELSNDDLLSYVTGKSPGAETSF